MEGDTGTLGDDGGLAMEGPFAVEPESAVFGVDGATGLATEGVDAEGIELVGNGLEFFFTLSQKMRKWSSNPAVSISDNPPSSNFLISKMSLILASD